MADSIWNRVTSFAKGEMMRKFLLMTLLLCPLVGTTSLNAQRGRDDWNYRNDADNVWNPSWNRRPLPRAGACFFTTAGFSGNQFCVRRGDRLPRLPGSFGDNISSIKILGPARVTVFNDRNFSGGSAVFRTSVADLRNYRFRDGHTWNNRISSIMVR